MRIKVLSVGEESSKKSTKGFYKVFNLSYLTDGKSRSKDRALRLRTAPARLFH